MEAKKYTKADFFKALHKQESNEDPSPPPGDHGKAIGPFQIWEVYWKDSGISEKYPEVTKLDVAKKCVDGYMKRYAKDAWSDAMTLAQVEKCARIHNGGPTGHTKAATQKYWQQFKAKLGQGI
eukprot:TRINITY_DN89274_c0_g1_i1.p2 TRINITY_DN89274_c0_g1~~TRINITY_DN89274_c0_g1_i1.p2  ORF type:complete len:123 (+),score=15.24 TRINITY_DN89274_c0_g1_i1:219-587(+)